MSLDNAILDPSFPKEILGNGSYGVAFAITREFCLKITTSKSEYNTAQVLAGKKLETVWNIYSCGEVPAEWAPHYAEQVEEETGRYANPAQLFYIIGERLRQVNPSRMEKLNRSYGRKLKAAVNRELERFGVYHCDMHFGNVLQTPKGKLKFVDVQ